MATNPLPPTAHTAQSQLDKLEALIAAAQAARHAAGRGLVFSSRAGADLLDAMHDLTEVDALHDFAQDVCREIGADGDDWSTIPTLRPITLRAVEA